LKKERASLTKIVGESITNLGIRESSERITDKLLDIDIVSGYYDFQDWLSERRRERK
jgi:hypothetical protein